MTPHQRLAWAKKNQVAPPSYAQLPAHGPEQQPHLEAPRQGAESTNAGQGCCSAAVKRPADACCQSAKSKGVQPSAGTSTSPRKVVLSMFALQCQGQSSAFTLLPWAILATAQPIVTYERELGATQPLAVADPSPVFVQPDTPPPKPMHS